MDTTKAEGTHKRAAIFYNQWCKGNRPNYYSEARNCVDFATDFYYQETNSLRQERKELKKSLEKAFSGLQTAIATIRAHNGIGMDDRLEAQSWKAYQHSQEMKMINEAFEEAQRLLEQ